jgi:4-carboxymuconolactone decarboxylase
MSRKQIHGSGKTGRRNRKRQLHQIKQKRKGLQSTLKRTYPKFVEIFDNFTFDKVIRYGKLDTRTRLMVILASLITSQTLSEYKAVLGGTLNVGVTTIEVKEIVYQSVPYGGIAKAFDFIHATNEILENRGIKLSLEGQSATSPET